jgi:hypothetical protein
MIGAGDDYQVTITYSPTNSTTSKEKRDSITVKAISNDPNQKKPIDVKAQGREIGSGLCNFAGPPKRKVRPRSKSLEHLAKGERAD